MDAKWDKRPDEGRFAIGITFQHFLHPRRPRGAAHQMIENIIDPRDVAQRRQDARRRAADHIARPGQAGQPVPADGPDGNLRQVFKIPPKATARNLSEAQDFPGRPAFQNAVRIVDGQRRQGLAQAARRPRPPAARRSPCRNETPPRVRPAPGLPPSRRSRDTRPHAASGPARRHRDGPSPAETVRTFSCEKSSSPGSKDSSNSTLRCSGCLPFHSDSSPCAACVPKIPT